MGNILSIDYGQAKVGLAVSLAKLAFPLKVIRYENIDELFVKIKKVVDQEMPEKIVIGVSSGQMAKDSKTFGEKLGDYVELPIVFVDETLSTKDVQSMSIEAGINRKKRRNMEDAFAAALILQNYLDS